MLRSQRNTATGIGRAKKIERRRKKGLRGAVDGGNPQSSFSLRLNTKGENPPQRPTSDARSPEASGEEIVCTDAADARHPRRPNPAGRFQWRVRQQKFLPGEMESGWQR